MAQYALMIDNEYCTGCHSCEISCRNELDLPIGQWGIRLLELGPWKLMDGKHWEHRYMPVLTSYCNLCSDRLSREEVPACALHCLASVIDYGTVEELAIRMAVKGKMCTLLVP